MFAISIINLVCCKLFSLQFVWSAAADTTVLLKHNISTDENEQRIKSNHIKFAASIFRMRWGQVPSALFESFSRQQRGLDTASDSAACAGAGGAGGGGAVFIAFIGFESTKPDANPPPPPPPALGAE